MKQDFFSKQQDKSGFSWGVIRQPQPKSNTTWIWILALLLLAFGIFWYFYKHKLFNQNLPITTIESGYVIGETINAEGILKADGDILTYTHTLIKKNDEKLLLKSSTIPLNNYSNNLSGVFAIEGTIESIYESLPIVEVKSIMIKDENKTSTGSENEEPIEPVNPGIYINKAAIRFPAEFFDQYAFIGEAWTNGAISIKNLDNEKITKISFFDCSDQGDTNCKQLTRTFENTAVKKVTTLNGDIFYKLPEIQSRYFQNGNWRGYFINNADDEEVEKIKNLIEIANPEVIKNLVTHYGVKTCLGVDNGTDLITSHKVQKVAEGLKVTMQGEGEKTFTCEAMIDLAQATKMKFIDIKTEASKEPDTEDKINEEKEEKPKQEEKKTEKEESLEQGPISQNPTDGSITPSEKQFPINLEKTLAYNSSRGEYVMTFPSSNISYSSDATDENFDQVGVRCNYGIKVIKYPDREHLMTNPSVIIYECSFKNEFKLPAENYFLKKIGEKNFVIEVKDPAWFDFAKNISISDF